MDKATKEYEIFRIRQDKEYISEFDKEMEKYLKGERESMKKYKFQHERLNELMTRADEIKGFMETRELTDAEAQELAEIRDDVKAIKDALGIAEEIGDEREETSGEETEAIKQLMKEK